MQVIRDYIFLILPWTIFIPLVIALMGYTRLPASLKCITWYLLLSAATQVISFLLWKAAINNYPILHVYTFLECWVLLAFYYQINKTYLAKKYWIALAIVFPLLFLVDSLLLRSVYAYNTYSRTVEALLFIFLSVYWFIKLVADVSVQFHAIRPLGFMVCGFLLYFSSSVALFALNSYINDIHLNMRLNVWAFHSFVTGCLYVFISIGLWKHQKG